jgi:hypothetical protein
MMASRTALWAVGLLAAVLVVAVAGCGGRDGGGSRDTDWPGRAPTVAAGCPSDTDGSMPDSPPAGVVWSPLSAEVPLLVPASGRYGPCRVSDTTAAGYARTPRGALVAAAQIMARASIPGPVGRDTIEGQVVAGPWRDELVESMDERTAAPGPPDVAMVGFAVAAWTSDQARVAVAVTSRRLPGRFLVFWCDLVWRGDWRMHPPPGGDWSQATTAVTALPAGFVAWGV